ncbi:MAG: hypothetical protein DRN15_03780 [Thermoprotei archaeon]|nr:MAG: hypothetical protein DRN15_03780 [Thermoprotei archaeon]
MPKHEVHKRGHLLEFSLVTSLFLAVFCIYMLKQFSSPLLYGINGPYYYIQVKSLFVRGSLKYFDPPLAFYILAGFSAMIGDLVSGIKVGSVLITLLGMYAMYYMMRNYSSILEGLMATASYALLSELIRLSFDLIKNAMGLTFLSFMMLFCYLALKKSSLWYSILASVFVLMTGLTHILDFVIACAILMLLAIEYLRDQGHLKYLAPPIATNLTILMMRLMFVNVMGGDLYKGFSYLRSLFSHEVKGVLFMMRTAPRLVFPLALGIAGFITALKLPEDVDRRFFSSISIVLIALNTPIHPEKFLWRFNLMTAILAPPILGLLVGQARDEKARVALALTLLGLIAPQFMLQLQYIRPSITLEEYHELRQLVSIIPEDVVLVAPDIQLKYWIETMIPSVVRTVKEASHGSYVVLVLRKMMFRTRRIIPPVARLIYGGRFIHAYLLPPR